MTTPPQIMGILNVTPDSFSGDGVMHDSDYVSATLKQATQMAADGASIIDIGGESTRPGAAPVAADEEMRRVVPVIAAIRAAHPALPLSIDTQKPAVARAALEAGATMINDIAGEKMDEAMLALAAERRVPLVMMHNASDTEAVFHNPTVGGEYRASPYADIVKDVCAALARMAARAIKAGIAQENIILDPGIGFGKSVDHNMRLINGVDAIKALGYPVLIGASRKSFIGRILDLPPDERLEGTAAITAIATLRGADILRVHDVRFMARVAKMAAAVGGC